MATSNKESNKMLYIDVRGTWPVLIEGMKATTLVGADRNITVQQAVERTNRT